MSLLATAFGTKVAIAALSLVAIGGGTAVAAATGTLPASPSSVQTEEPTSAPTADGTETATPTAEPADTAPPSSSATKGPDATGPAAFGLCTAYTAGGLHHTSVAYKALLSASQTAGSIADYCAPIVATLAVAHGPTSTPTPDSSATSTHGKSGSEHGNATSGSHGH